MLDRSDPYRVVPDLPARRAGDRDTGLVAARRLTALVGCMHPIMAVAVIDAAARGSIHCYDVIADSDELVARVGRERPDLCLVITPWPVGLPGVLTRLTAASRSTRAVVLSGDEHSAGEVLAALRAGALGWLPLRTDSRRLVDALRAVSQGEAAVPRILLSSVLAELRGSGARDVVAADGSIWELSPREHDVLVALGEGLTTAQAAERLGIGVATARGYVASAVRRLGATDRAAAVRMVQSRPGTRA